MNEKEIVYNLLKDEQDTEIQKLVNYIYENINNDKVCYAHIFRFGYLNLSKDTIRKVLKTILNTKNLDIILKALPYIRKDFNDLVLEIAPYIEKKYIPDLIRNTNNDELKKELDKLCQ